MHFTGTVHCDPAELKAHLKTGGKLYLLRLANNDGNTPEHAAYDFVGCQVTDETRQTIFGRRTSSAIDIDPSFAQTRFESLLPGTLMLDNDKQTAFLKTDGGEPIALTLGSGNGKRARGAAYRALRERKSGSRLSVIGKPSLSMHRVFHAEEER